MVVHKDIVEFLKNPFRNPFQGIGAPTIPGTGLPAPTGDPRSPTRPDRSTTDADRAAAIGARRILMTLPDGTVLYFDEWNEFVVTLDNYRGYTGPVIGVNPDKIHAAISSINRWWDGYGGAGDGTEVDPEEFNIDDFLASLLGGPGGGRRGAVGPTYVRPDEATVREGLGLYVSTVVGEDNGDILNEAVRLYFKGHRANFDNKGQQIDATTAAKEYVRGTAAYKDIHELRPDNMDELRWVTSTQGQLRKLGVNPGRTEKLGIELARTAASEQAVQKAGETAFQRQNGRIHTDQRNRLKRAAGAAAGLL